MGIKITIPNTSSDTLTFGSANTTTAAQIAGIDSGSTNGQLAFYTTATGTSTERMRIDASGNVGIGMSSPTTPLMVKTDTDFVIGIGKTSAGSGARVGAYNLAVNAYKDIVVDGATVQFAVSGTEKARIDSSGNLLVGTTTAADSSGVGVKIFPSYSGSGAPEVACVSSTSGTSYGSWYMYSTADSQYKFYVNYAGTVFARSTSITGLSDISEKENIKPLETGLSEILALQPRRFDWKAGDKKNVAGFVAQEVQSVLPDLIEEYKSSNTETKLGLKMGDMIPTLVKAIQEQQALITQLQADVAALKGTA